jgi:hypothetical protein
MKFLTIILAICLMPLFTGCRSSNHNKLWPSKYDESISFFDNYEHALDFFELIKPGETNLKQLSKMGFDINKENVQLLNYVQVQEMFLTTASITKADLPDGVLECLEAKDGCIAYRMVIEKVDEKRYGSFFADLLEFRKKTNQSGWRFEALFVVVGDTIVYALHSGEPHINKNEVIKNPLGPLNHMSGRDIFKPFL